MSLKKDRKLLSQLISRGHTLRAHIVDRLNGDHVLQEVIANVISDIRSDATNEESQILADITMVGFCLIMESLGRMDVERQEGDSDAAP